MSTKSRAQRFRDEQKALGNKQIAVWATPAAIEQWSRIRRIAGGDATDQAVLSTIAKIICTMDDMEIIDRLSRQVP